MTNIPRDIEIDRSRVPVAQGGWVDIAQALKDRWTIEIGEMTETVSPDEYAKLFQEQPFRDDGYFEVRQSRETGEYFLFQSIRVW